MYIVYCQNKPKSEHIVSEYIDTYFEVGYFINHVPTPHSMIFVYFISSCFIIVIYLYLCQGP